MSAARKENLDELIKNNTELMLTVAWMRGSLLAAHEAIGMVIDLAEPIAGQHEPEPVEYVIHADNLDALRQVLIDYRTPA